MKVSPDIAKPKIGMIAAYGLHWFVSAFEASGYRLLGETQDHRVADFREQNGLYVLYEPRLGSATHNHPTIRNIGIATKGTLSARLKHHRLEDHHAGRWDAFSWFGFREAVSNPGCDGWCWLKAVDNADTMPSMKPKHVIAELEALLVYIEEESDNRKQPKFRSAEEWRQLSADKWRSKRDTARMPQLGFQTSFAKGQEVRTRFGVGTIVGTFGKKFRVKSARDGQVNLVAVYNIELPTEATAT